MKTVGLYNEHHFKYLYTWMTANCYDSCEDITGKVWHKKDVQDILIHQYFWEMSA